MDIKNIIEAFKTFPRGLNIIALVNEVNKKVVIVQTRNFNDLMKRIIDRYYKLLDYNITDIVFLETKLYGIDKKTISPFINYYIQMYEDKGYSIPWKDQRLSKVRCVVRYFPASNNFRVLLISANGTKEVVGVFSDVVEAYEWAREYYHISKNPNKVRVLANNLNTRQSYMRATKESHRR